MTAGEDGHADVVRSGPGQGARGEISVKRGTAAARVSPGTIVPTHGDLPVHGQLPMAAGPLRGRCWTLLPDAVMDRMEELAGANIEWWARLLSGGPPHRVRATLLGTSGAVFADPVPGDLDDYVVACHQLEPDSLARVRVISRPDPPPRRAGPQAKRGRRRTDPTSTEPDDGDAWPAARHRNITGLSSTYLNVLDTMPPRAVELLTAPFRSNPVLQADHYYEGTPERLDVFGIVFVGRRELTLATGARLIPTGHTPRTAHWALTCGRARIIGRASS